MTTRRTTPEGDIMLLRQTEIDLTRGTMNKRWTYELPDGARVVRDTRVRLYLSHALGELLLGAGFVDVAFFGSVAGEPLALDIELQSRP